MRKATATFDVTGWVPADGDTPDVGPHLTRIAIRKSFRGALEGESAGEGLFCGMNAPEAGAGYVVSERVTGRLDGRSGTFVLQHGSLMGPDVLPHTFGHVVPGSGTGQLAGLRGEVEIHRDDDGTHTLVLTYSLPTS